METSTQTLLIEIKKCDPMYHYKATIVDVYDGDTFTFIVDLGFSITVKEKIRLSGVDTPELRGEERELGLKVRDYVEKLILNKECEITVFKKGKYGRYIARVMYPIWVEMEGFSEADGGDWSNGKKGIKKTLQYKDLAKELLTNHLAKKLDY